MTGERCTEIVSTIPTCLLDMPTLHRVVYMVVYVLLIITIASLGLTLSRTIHEDETKAGSGLSGKGSGRKPGRAGA